MSRTHPEKPNLISDEHIGLGMPNHFCPRCHSFVWPGRDTCQKCGASVSDTFETSQKSLFEVAEDTPEPEVLAHVNEDAPYLPYAPRSTQLQIIRDIRESLDNGRHIVIESGTGTGKTIVSLAAALEHAVPRGKRIIYLTRTITQSDQVMKELKAISRLKSISGVPVTGRARSCPTIRSLKDSDSLSATVLSSICEEKKAKHQCRYFESLKDKLPEVDAYVRKNFPKSDELDRFCERIGACPYEMKKLLMKGCEVIAAPYVHILSEDIRSNFLRNMDVDESQIVLVIDEAHNLIDAARSQESFTIDNDMLDNAIDECSTIKGDTKLHDGMIMKEFLEHVKRTIKSLATELIPLGKTEALLKPVTMLEDRIFDRFHITRDQLSIALDRLEDIGEARTERLMEEGDARVSDIFTVAILLKKWMLTRDEMFIRAVKTAEKGEYLHAACINPFDVVSFIRNQKGAVHMSGTLQPLDQYVKVLSLPKDTVTEVYPSPFPKENRKVLYMTNVTTRYQDMKANPAIFNIMERHIAKLCNLVHKNTLVFFPSYSLMKQMRPYLERDIRKDLYWEESGRPNKTTQALTAFRAGRDGVFCSVMGGSVAEGIDFPGEELCFAIIVGIPFPPPTLENNAMSDMYDEKYGPWMGWRYVSLAPAMRKMKQAIGRLIRTETDRGMAVIMDSRVSKYRKELEAEPTEDVLGDTAKFFEGM